MRLYFHHPSLLLLVLCVCHHCLVPSLAKLSTRIVGGNAVVDDSLFPWFVKLGDSGSGCGGTLVYSDMVLTAAHCGVSVGDRVVMGSADLNVKSPFETRVVDFFPHPLFQDIQQGNPYDVQLIRLQVPAPATPLIMNSDTTLPYDGDWLKALGHGWQDEAGASGVSPVLHQVDLRYIQDCTDPQYVYGQFQEAFNFDNSIHICAAEQGKDACKGMTT
jgi:secreted trypsin-like serine protease